MANLIYPVTPNLFLSGVQPLSAFEQFYHLGITAILNVTQHPDPHWPASFAYKQVPTPDDGLPKSPAWFGPGIHFVLLNLNKPNGKVLIHCIAGENRSPAMMYAVLRARGYPVGAASSIVFKADPVAKPLYFHYAEAAVHDLGYANV